MSNKRKDKNGICNQFIIFELKFLSISPNYSMQKGEIYSGRASLPI